MTSLMKTEGECRGEAMWVKGEQPSVLAGRDGLIDVASHACISWKEGKGGGRPLDACG